MLLGAGDSWPGGPGQDRGHWSYVIRLLNAALTSKDTSRWFLLEISCEGAPVGAWEEEPAPCRRKYLHVCTQEALPLALRPAPSQTLHWKRLLGDLDTNTHPTWRRWGWSNLPAVTRLLLLSQDGCVCVQKRSQKAETVVHGTGAVGAQHASAPAAQTLTHLWQRILPASAPKPWQ